MPGRISVPTQSVVPFVLEHTPQVLYPFPACRVSHLVSADGHVRIAAAKARYSEAHTGHMVPVGRWRGALSGPFPAAPGPNPPCQFPGNGLSSDYYVSVLRGCRLWMPS